MAATPEIWPKLDPISSNETISTVSPDGIVCIDPASFVGFAPLGTIPANGVLDLSVPISDVPGLNALSPHVQNVIQPPAGTPYLSNAIAPVIL